MKYFSFQYFIAIHQVVPLVAAITNKKSHKAHEIHGHIHTHTTVIERRECCLSMGVSHGLDELHEASKDQVHV